ncbi:hypothetical protein PHYPSEUDO_006847 [Phytophthora pseudosyringae]|uniref:Ankyrin repeat protein n=1 Tax=Phytophthora pseudosyringae TaxID=221518 RepID=A0A8T1WDK0_9STRA|nr:hypothetical protein PHYPSEUDO_006847 [Phytophthora pseudosyringae]
MASSPPASTLVLANRPLFRLIMAFIDGVPGRVVSLVGAFQCGQRGVPWSTPGALPRAAIQRGDLETLRHLRTLSTTKTFGSRPELAFDGAVRCAIRFGRLEILRYLADTGLLLDENWTTGSTGRTVGSTLLGWAVRYSEALASTKELEIVEWVARNYSSSALRDVTAEELSRARVPVLRFLKARGLATSGFDDPRLADLVATMGKMETLRFLLETEDEAINGHVEVVIFLGEHRHEGPHEYALERAAAQGNVDCVDALIRCSICGCLFEARRAALQAGHPRVAALLSAWMNPDVRSCSSMYNHVRPGPRWCQRLSQTEKLFEAVPASKKTMNECEVEMPSSVQKPTG